MYSAVLWAALFAMGAGAESARFVQEEFAIGLWVDPPLDERADERYRELAEAHFTLVIGGFGGPEAALQAALCEKYGLGLIASGRRGDPADLADGPAVWGYALRDEPHARDFPELRERADAVRAARPGKLPYINLFPNYADAEQLGTETYEEHVRLFIETVRPEVLSMDNYPLFHPGRDTRERYRENLEIFREQSQAAGIPFWNFFNTMPYGPHTDPTEGQLRWQIYTSLAYGARGVLYFCYYTPAGGEFPKGGAIIQRDGRRTRHYYEAQRINAELKRLGPVLMQLRSTADVRVDESAGDVPSEKLAGQPITDLTRDTEDPPLDLLVGAFAHDDGRRAVLLNNYHFAYTAWPTVAFDSPTEAIREVDKYSGELIPLIDDSPAMEGIQISLGAGDGRLFLMPGGG
ncbi:MAG: beta-galactosidase [Candidatus Hydrogenedentes bacterium]|nr:beta-galactosidase [Candidatus Hydrogenedentota bacterium]